MQQYAKYAAIAYSHKTDMPSYYSLHQQMHTEEVSRLCTFANLHFFLRKSPINFCAVPL